MTDLFEVVELKPNVLPELKDLDQGEEEAIQLALTSARFAFTD